MTATRKAIVQRLRESSVADVVRRRLRGDRPEPRWEGVEDVDAAADALVAWSLEANAARTDRGMVVTVGDGGSLQAAVDEKLRRSDQPFDSLTIEQVPAWTTARPDDVAIVLCAYPDARRITDTAEAIGRHPVLANVRFEYASGLYPERLTFARLDEYSTTWFISPVLLDVPSPYEIYAESLSRFEQKCGLRDYLDLYQLLTQVVRSGVSGDIAEFGSYRGHSGYLIARTLDALESDKQLFMFDTFEEFPEEPYGVDRFWSRTHTVDFASVQAKFAGLDRVTLVKGDFTSTLGASDLDRVALAYVDCDSYRATRFLIDALWPERIAPGGLLVFEDYGHPALLGNRVAVREGLRKFSGCFQFFSQFSGLYIAMKRPEPHV